MTTKHTPGPWFCENGDNRWAVWHDEGMACICDVHTGVEPDPSGATHAHLIAAAPDLLAACEMLVKAMNTASDDVERAIFVMEKAIAKAKGEKT